MSVKRSLDGNIIYHPARLRGGGPFGDVEEPDFAEELFDEDVMDEEDLIPDEIMAAAADDSVYQDVTGEMKARWKRPPVPSFNNDQDLNLQWLDIDMVAGAPLKQNPNGSEHVVGSQTGQVPILRLFGVNETGNSVVLFIHGFTPYSYFALPAGYEFDETEENLAKVRNAINERLQTAVRGGQQDATYCHGVSYIRDHRSIMGYETPHTKFFKVMLAMPTMVPKLKRIMEDGISLPGVRATGGSVYNGDATFQPFEANVPFVLRYMIDRDISGAGWLTLPQGTYQVRTDTTKKQTHCQLEVDVTYNDIIPRKSEGEWNKIAPLRVLSVDIECQGRKGHFPEAEKDPVIQIANVVSVYGQGKVPIVQVYVCKLPSSLLLFCLIQSSQSSNPSLSCRVPVECFYVERVPSYCRRSSDFQRRGGGHAYEVEAVHGNMRS